MGQDEPYRLAKVGVAGSNPVVRSIEVPGQVAWDFFFPGVKNRVVATQARA